MAGIGAASVAWPLIDQMNPAADTLALASTEVDLSSLEEGQAITVNGEVSLFLFAIEHLKK